MEIFIFSRVLVIFCCQERKDNGDSGSVLLASNRWKSSIIVPCSNTWKDCQDLWLSLQLTEQAYALSDEKFKMHRPRGSKIILSQTLKKVLIWFIFKCPKPEIGAAHEITMRRLIKQNGGPSQPKNTHEIQMKFWLNSLQTPLKSNYYMTYSWQKG